MVFRTAGAVATLLIGLAGSGGQALAQYYPPPQAYPPPPAYPPANVYPPQRQLPPMNADDDAQFYEPPPVYRLPPGTTVPPESLDPPPGRMGRMRPPADIEPAYVPPPPPGHLYRDDLPPPGAVRPGVDPRGYDSRGYEPAPGARPYPGVQAAPLPPPPGGDPRGYDPRGYEPPAAGPRPYYPGTQAAPLPPPGADPRGYDPAAAASRPYYPGAQGAPPPGVAVAPGPGEQQDGFRPPMPIGPDPNATGAVRDPRTQMAALPPEVRPEFGPRKELPAQFRRALVDFRTKEPAGTIVIDTPNTYLYLVLGNGKAMRYGVGVGREGFTWAGAEKVTKMAEWPDWNPPPEMIERQPYLPRFMAGGEGNPLGARALYLGKTVYRIHGTNQPSTIGTFVSSGCIRLTNEDVMDLYTRIKVGTRVVVLPGSPPAPGAAMPIGPQATQGLPPPPVSMAPPTPPGAVPVEGSRLPPPPYGR
jgi:lipoprotein-anchoring transpeptidase ErfK/SrfK